MLRAFKYELRPTDQQKVLLEKHFGANRFVYNWALDIKKKHYAETKKSLSQFDIMRKLTAMKADKPWMSEVASQSMQQTIAHLESAFVAFFKKRADFPKFKSKHKSKKAYTVPQGISIDHDNQTIKLPKLGAVRFFKDRKFEGDIRQATISASSTGRYYVSMLVETGTEAPVLPTPSKDAVTGIDLGIKDFAITSDGQIFENPKYFISSQKRLGIYQKRLSRAVKGSKNREKLRQKVARVHEHIANQRRDFQHKVSTELTRSENQATVIAMETLSAENLLKNSRLAKHISDAAWHQFKQFIEYKCSWYGKHFVQIGRFEPSSKTCSKCGWYFKDLTLKVRSWECPSCHTHHDRDVNAACNIRNFGWLSLNKSLGVVDAAPSINKAPLSGLELSGSDEVGKTGVKDA
jgi:putative transposase